MKNIISSQSQKMTLAIKKIWALMLILPLFIATVNQIKSSAFGFLTVAPSVQQHVIFYDVIFYASQLATIDCKTELI